MLIITHPDYATIKIRVDKTKERLGTIIGAGSAFAAVGKDDIMMRTFDGRVIETFLNNDIKITGYLEKKESEQFKQHLTTYTHLFSFPDGTITKVQSNDIAIIGAVDRQKFTHPSEFFLQLFCLPSERKQGVYTGDLKNALLWTKDEEGNLFELSAQGKVRAKIAVSFDMGDANQSPEYSQDEYFDQVNEYLPFSQETIQPILYIINGDSTGKRIWSEEEIENYFRLAKQDPNTQILTKNQIKDIQSLQILTQINPKELNMIDKQIPKVIDTITKTSLNQKDPQQQRFIYRNFTKYAQFDRDAKLKIEQDLENIKKFEETIKQKRSKNKIEIISSQLSEKVKWL